jgi:hypothetical protein
LIKIGRHEEAVAEIKRAQELDPFSLIINTVVGKSKPNTIGIGRELRKSTGEPSNLTRIIRRLIFIILSI